MLSFTFLPIVDLVNRQQIEDKLAVRNYARNTKKTYLAFLHKFDVFCELNGLDTGLDAKPFILSLIKENHSISTQNQAINAIKFYWEQVLGKERTYISIDRPMKERTLPSVLSLTEVEAILSTIRNFKHKMVLTTIYGCGLRISELLNLKISNIDSARMSIYTKGGKGRKDRVIPLPASLLIDLRTYFQLNKPKYFLFEGIKPGTAYSATSIRNVLQKAVQNVGIKKKVTVHTLRHSYATHLYERGINLRSIQVLLVHNSSKTTEIYTHVSNTHINNTPSPLEFLSSRAKLE